jgi:hypothetical protein
VPDGIIDSVALPLKALATTMSLHIIDIINIRRSARRVRNASARVALCGGCSLQRCEVIDRVFRRGFPVSLLHPLCVVEEEHSSFSHTADLNCPERCENSHPPFYTTPIWPACRLTGKLSARRFGLLVFIIGIGALVLFVRKINEEDDS